MELNSGLYLRVCFACVVLPCPASIFTQVPHRFMPRTSKLFRDYTDASSRRKHQLFPQMRSHDTSNTIFGHIPSVQERRTERCSCSADMLLEVWRWRFCAWQREGNVEKRGMIPCMLVSCFDFVLVLVLIVLFNTSACR